MPSWFHALFGFEETTYAQTRARFEVSGTKLRSSGNGREFGIGTFATPTLADLRRAAAGRRRGRLRVTHEVIDDVLPLHARPENAHALFQVASQFNCLEFASPSMTPEDGVTGYAHDSTQGPACALAAAAAAVYRTYFVPCGGALGQTRDRQLDNLDGLAARLGGDREFFTVRNGYTASSEARLAALAHTMGAHARDDLLGAVKIGVQRGVEVTFASRFTPPPAPVHVSQAFCSALACGYSTVALEAWAPLATLVLDAAYEATLLAAVVDAEETGGSGRVWLTFLGGGAFGNRKEWIGAAVGRALARLGGVDLDVRVAHHRTLDRDLLRTIEDATKTRT